MRRLTAAWILWLGVCWAPPASAQIGAPAPPGPFVVDLHGAFSAIPQDAGFFPPLPAATVVPSRGTGIEVGAHVYLMRLGGGRLGIGVRALRVHGSASPAVPASESASPSTAAAHPEVEATISTVTPQLSLNFGSADGWSYVSVGVGRARVTTGTSAFGGGEGGTDPTPARAVDSGARSSANIGGGARWFLKRHVAFSFDVRFHVIAAGAAEGMLLATPRTTLLIASAGISVK